MLRLMGCNASRVAMAAALMLAAQSSYATDAVGSPNIPDSARKFAQFCYQVDGSDAAQVKTRLEACKPGLDSLKSTTDVEAALAGLAKDAAERVHAATEAKRVEQWGQTWTTALVITDVIAILVAVLVVIGVLKSPDPTSFLCEDAIGNQPGKGSFGRLLGLVGGLASLAFVGLITNICLSYLFTTGKLPDQLGPIYATAVGTFFASLIPYLIGKLKS